MIRDLIALCQKGGFILASSQKWISNTRVVLQATVDDQRAKDLRELDLDRDKIPVETALSLQWGVETDLFRFKMEIKHHSLMACCQSTVLYKILWVSWHQSLCKQKLCNKNSVEEVVNGMMLYHMTSYSDGKGGWSTWICWLHSTWTGVLSQWTLDWLKMPNYIILHMQVKKGYGTATYIQMLNKEIRIQVTFPSGKARVMPLKAVTIPRLELTAAVLAVRVDSMLKAELKVHLEDSVLWTDSTSVLKYLNNEDKRFHTFETSEPSQWVHKGMSAQRTIQLMMHQEE